MPRFCFAFTIFLFFQIPQVFAHSSPCSRALSIIRTAEKYHYKPKPVNDDFSALVFSTYLQMIDADHLLFTAREQRQLDAFKHSLDDEILHQQCTFLEKVTELYHPQLLFADSLLKTLQYEKLDFSTNDSLTLNDEEICSNQQDLKEKWKKQIKLQVLLYHVSNTDTAERPQSSFSETLFDIQKTVVNRESCRIAALINDAGGMEEHLSAMLLKAIAQAYDPHTAYFTPAEESEFEAMLSREVFAYGFQLAQNKADEIEIIKLIPGGPAWNSNSINEGDILLAVKAPQGLIKPVGCLRLEEVLLFLADEATNEVSFHVRKRSGKKIQVTLFKDKIRVEENVIKSFILEEHPKIGYIYLPTFYTQPDGDSYGSDGCANDLAKELIRLKQDNIEGLILDLRNNPGGSMLEAIRLAGMFINYGALAILHSRREEPVTLKDMDRGTVYDGPLVVLMNPFSASASELFAAALQDHRRAVVVGSASFGKSTAQDVMPLETSPSQTGSSGFLKLTTGKFYRVTGQSLQQQGVAPDIKLTDIYDQLAVGESTYPSSLAPSSIEKKTYYYPYQPLPLQKLRTLSARRVESDSAFISLQAISESLSTIQHTHSVSLNLNSFKAYYTARPYYQDDYYAEEKEALLVKDLSETLGISSLSEPEKVLHQEVTDKISKDAHIRESYYIINDLIKLTKNTEP